MQFPQWRKPVGEEQYRLQVTEGLRQVPKVSLAAFRETEGANEHLNTSGLARAFVAAPLLRTSGTRALRLQSSTVPGTGEHVHAFLSRFQLGAGHSAPILPTGKPRLSSHTLTGAARATGPAPPTPRPAAHLFVPDLQGLAADAVEDGEEAALERVLEHLASRGPAAALGPGLEVGTERRRREGAAGPKEGR